MQERTTLHASPDSAESRPWLRLGAVLIPILKCALCPACLSVFGSAFAGARLGFLNDEPWHVAIVLVVLIADIAILGASMRHHRRRGPLALCAAGALGTLAGHLTSELVEYAGFALLFVAGIWNLVLLRRHRRADGSCCADAHASHSAEPIRNAA